MAASVFMVHRILGGCTLAGSLREEDATLSSRLATVYAATCVRYAASTLTSENLPVTSGSLGNLDRWGRLLFPSISLWQMLCLNTEFIHRESSSSRAISINS